MQGRLLQSTSQVPFSSYWKVGGGGVQNCPLVTQHKLGRFFFKSLSVLMKIKRVQFYLAFKMVKVIQRNIATHITSKDMRLTIFISFKLLSVDSYVTFHFNVTYSNRT